MKASRDEILQAEVIAYLEQCAIMWALGRRPSPAAPAREIAAVTGCWSEPGMFDYLALMAQAGLIDASDRGGWQATDPEGKELSEAGRWR